MQKEGKIALLFPHLRFLHIGILDIPILMALTVIPVKKMLEQIMMTGTVLDIILVAEEGILTITAGMGIFYQLEVSINILSAQIQLAMGNPTKTGPLIMR
jgi:hypothetical protein